MQNTPKAPKQPASPISNPPKKPPVGPTSRAQINLKTRRKKNIPQIKIELDQMLHEAFNQMNVQPKKNVRLGVQDIYLLDNQLLRDYVDAVYHQYGIVDPLLPDRRIGDSRHEPSTYQTPQKTPNHNNQANFSQKIESSSKNPRSSFKSIKTTQRITKLKQNFQSELQTHATTVLQDDQRTPLKQKQEQIQATRIKDTTSKRPQIKINRRSSQNIPSHAQSRKNSNHSILLKKTKYKYCLMCEQPLQNDLINLHQRQCEQLQKLLNTPNLKIDQITTILTKKITNLQKQIQAYRNNIYEDAHRVQQLLNQINVKSQLPYTYTGDQAFQESDDEEDSNLMKVFSGFSVVKCMECLDKLRWFRKMRMKAEVKRGRLGPDRLI